MLKLILMITPLVASINYNVKMRDQVPEVDDEHGALENVEYPYHDRPDIFKIDGVEYVDRSNRNPTMKLIFQEKFFTNMQQNFFN